MGTTDKRGAGRRHRRLGIVAALVVLLLAVTALVLNHARELGVDRLLPDAMVLRRLPGVAPADEPRGLVHALPAGELRSEGGMLTLAGRPLGDCPQLVGVVEQAGQVLAVCRNRLWLLTPDGQVIDQADGGRGVPEGLSAVAHREGQVLLRHGGESLAVDLNDLSLRPALPGAGVVWSEDLPEGAGGGHHLPGSTGLGFMDGLALAAAALALSGLFVAWRRRS